MTRGKHKERSQQAAGLFEPQASPSFTEKHASTGHFDKELGTRDSVSQCIRGLAEIHAAALETIFSDKPL